MFPGLAVCVAVGVAEETTGGVIGCAVLVGVVVVVLVLWPVPATVN